MAVFYHSYLLEQLNHQERMNRMTYRTFQIQEISNGVDRLLRTIRALRHDLKDVHEERKRRVGK